MILIHLIASFPLCSCWRKIYSKKEEKVWPVFTGLSADLHGPDFVFPFTCYCTHLGFGAFFWELEQQVSCTYDSYVLQMHEELKSHQGFHLKDIMVDPFTDVILE
jgi:hypothetical protein